MQPINYLGMIPQPDFGESLLQGLRIGAGIQQMQAATELKQQQLLEKKQAMELQEQYARDLQATLQNPTAQGFAALTAKYPKPPEAFHSSWKPSGASPRHFSSPALPRAANWLLLSLMARSSA